MVSYKENKHTAWISRISRTVCSRTSSTWWSLLLSAWCPGILEDWSHPLMQDSAISCLICPVISALLWSSVSSWRITELVHNVMQLLGKVFSFFEPCRAFFVLGGYKATIPTDVATSSEMLVWFSEFQCWEMRHLVLIPSLDIDTVCSLGLIIAEDCSSAHYGFLFSVCWVEFCLYKIKILLYYLILSVWMLMPWCSFTQNIIFVV